VKGVVEQMNENLESKKSSLGQTLIVEYAPLRPVDIATVVAERESNYRKSLSFGLFLYTRLLHTDSGVEISVPVFTGMISMTDDAKKRRHIYLLNRLVETIGGNEGLLSNHCVFDVYTTLEEKERKNLEFFNTFREDFPGYINAIVQTNDDIEKDDYRIVDEPLGRRAAEAQEIFHSRRFRDTHEYMGVKGVLRSSAVFPGKQCENLLAFSDDQQFKPETPSHFDIMWA